MHSVGCQLSVKQIAVISFKCFFVFVLNWIKMSNINWKTQLFFLKLYWMKLFSVCLQIIIYFKITCFANRSPQSSRPYFICKSFHNDNFFLEKYCHHLQWAKFTTFHFDFLNEICLLFSRKINGIKNWSIYTRRCVDELSVLLEVLYNSVCLLLIIFL